jgi:hypothetical protein
MIGWAFLYAFLTFIIFISGLIGVAFLVMGSIKRDRSSIVFGLKTLLVTVLAISLSYVLVWPFIKTILGSISK